MPKQNMVLNKLLLQVKLLTQVFSNFKNQSVSLFSKLSDHTQATPQEIIARRETSQLNLGLEAHAIFII